MLKKEEFISFILEGPKSFQEKEIQQGTSALPEGFEDFGFDTETVQDSPADTRTTFTQRLLVASDFGLPEFVQTKNLIRSTDAVAKYLPGRASYWPKISIRPYQTLLFEANITHKDLLTIPAFKNRKMSHLDIVEDALARMVSEALDGFQRGGEGVTSDVRKGQKHETLCIISIMDERDQDPVRLVCFGTHNAKTGGLETFHISEQTRFWDQSLARDHLGLVYERQFKKLAGKSWQEAFTTTEERKQAEKLLEVCSKKNPTEKDIQEHVLNLLDTIAKGFGLRSRPGQPRRLQAYALPPDHDIGIDPEEMIARHGGKNPFGGVTLRDEKNRLLGYIVYPLKTKNDAETLRSYLEKNNRFHNVLVVFPDGNETTLELWQGKEPLAGKLRKGKGFEGAAEVINLLSRFFIVSKAKVRNPAELAQELAYRARYLRRLAVKQLDEEPERGPLRNLYNAFKEALVHDQTEDEFADAFAQTITYGLLTAKWTGNDQLVKDGERLTRQTALKLLQASSPFLNDLFKSALSVKLEEQRGRMLWLVDDIADLLDRIDVAYVFGAGDMDSDTATDPVIHFYEPFLSAYDKGMKNKRGVFFTPQPVVSHIVRNVHKLLQKEFGLEDGLASTDTWGDVTKRIDGLKIPEGLKDSEPFVRILDPATGTGTFLFECIEIIERTMKDHWCGELNKKDWRDPAVVARWNEYVPTNLLTRLYGFELMMASYTITHLKLTYKLNQTGYRHVVGERLRVYLTNTLEPASVSANPKLANLFSALSSEAQEVNRIKSERSFSVLIGNPPYSKSSANRGAYAESLVGEYKLLVSGETNVQPLSDDYIKFIAYSLGVTCSTASIVSMITNRSFLEGLIHRGLRSILVAKCAAIRILDLHGDTNVGETPPLGRLNENVFDITQGVAIWSFIRRVGSEKAIVDHIDVWGSKSEKYTWLLGHNRSDHDFCRLNPVEPYFFLAKKDLSGQDDQLHWVALTTLFSVYGMGVKSRRDNFLISHSRTELEERFHRLADAMDVEQLRLELGVTDNEQWTLSGMRTLVRRIGVREGVSTIVYRPFDTRYVWYHRRAIERGDARWPVMRHVVSGGLSLLSSRQSTNAEFTSAFVARGLSEMKAAESTRGSYAFPLMLEPVGSLAGTSLSSNLRSELILRGKNADDVDAAFAYVYAILYSPAYRTKYSGVLRIESPKIPPVHNPKLLDHLVTFGKELIGYHLMEFAEHRKNRTMYVGTENPYVEKIAFSNGTIWLDKKKTAGFNGVSDDVWNFHIGGYQVLEKWLKGRKSRTLSKEDIEYYQNIVIALSETIRIMKEIDDVIDKHGGWPGAFQTGKKGDE